MRGRGDDEREKEEAEGVLKD
jgi:hypothetical protein